MKPTGVVRKIDELGRIVIPKEIRRNLNIGDGEEVEIFVDNESIILKKYYRLLSLKEFAIKYIKVLDKYINCNLILTDKEKIIYSSKESFNHLVEEKINKQILDVINERKVILEKGKLLLTNDYLMVNYFMIMPIVVNTDSIGCIICTSNDAINEKLITVIEIIIALIKNNFEG